MAEKRRVKDILDDLTRTVIFLKKILADSPAPLYEIHKQQRDLRIKDSDLNTARRSLKIKTVRKQGVTYWELAKN